MIALAKNDGEENTQVGLLHLHFFFLTQKLLS